MVNIDGKVLARAIDAYCILSDSMTKDIFITETGISSATLSQWRTGKYDPSKKNVLIVEKYVGMPIEVFLSLFGSDKIDIKNLPPKNEDRYTSLIMGLCGDDVGKLRQVQDALAKEPEKTKAKFDLFLKTL